MRDALHAAFDIDACFYAIAAIGLNIHFGYTGLLNFGQAGFLLSAATASRSRSASWRSGCRSRWAS